MRSSAFLLTGFALLGAGIAVMTLALPGRWIVGPVLVAGGLALKVTGFVLDAAPPPRGRTITTLGTSGPRSSPVPPPPPGPAASADVRSWRDQEGTSAGRRRRAS